MTEARKVEFQHEPVLTFELLQKIEIPEGGTFLDLTVGSGGHLAAFAERASLSSFLFGCDRDPEAVVAARERLGKFPQVRDIIQAEFGSLREIMKRLDIQAADAILLDLGVSSHQINQGYRGFSFQTDGPLDMRMDITQTLNAAEIVNEFEVEDLARLIRNYGEEKRANRIARAIVNSRAEHKITTTTQLRQIISKALGPANLTKSLARVFQALRIKVNGELDQLEIVLPAAVDALAPDGKLAVISYHSLEDRIVKRFMRSQTGVCVCPPGLPVCQCGAIRRVDVLTAKPIAPSPEEVKKNPRSRSARLRIARKISSASESKRSVE
ncbi:MAG: 16S rRNA (cytosine(1402)-N(4))-methyltransferase RsmH [candidate division Zixibacteria bacterium]|nr:16S rRNA (cytosine(1402)-N(4))-methyltransferase RsmH [candidate division Zixibacteria bacterium]